MYAQLHLIQSLFELILSRYCLVVCPTRPTWTAIWGRLHCNKLAFSLTAPRRFLV